MSNQFSLAYMVWENAVHGWRTPQEIAVDEGIDFPSILSACEECLRPDMVEEVHRAARV